jgi:hypothetical protein
MSKRKGSHTAAAVRLAEDEESGLRGSEARRGRGMEQRGVAMTEDQRRSLYIILAAAIAGGSIASLSMWWLG